MSQPTVSIILLSYNQGEYVADAIESALSQTYSDFELLVVDNGSTDGSQAQVRTYQHDPRVRVFLHSEHDWISRRFNEALDAATGDFIGFLYSDDYYLPNKLEKQLAAFDQLARDYGVVYAPQRRLNVTTGRTWVAPNVGCSGWIFPALMGRPQRGELDMISPLVRRECFQQHRFYDDVFVETESIWLRVALTHRFHFLPEPLVVARDHSTNGGKALRRNLETSAECVKRLRESPHIPPDYQSLVDKYEGWLFRQYGWQAVRLNEDGRWARSCFAQAARVRKRELWHPRAVAGFLLSFVPLRAREKINSVGHLIRKAPNNRAYIRDYVGLENTGTPPPST